MALDLGCATRQPYYGDGSEVVFLYDFEILKTEDLHVAYWDNTKEEYFEILPDHPVHGWAKLDSLSKIEFNSPIADGQFFIIYRLTEVAPPKAFFVKGHPVKADDLNDNFEQLQFAILDNRCSIERLEENGNKEAGCSGTFRASFIVSDTDNKIELPAGFNSIFSGASFVYLNGVLLSAPTDDTTQQNTYSIFNEGAKFYLSFDYAPFESDVVDFVYIAPVDCDSPDLSPVANRSTTKLTEAVSQITLPLDFDQARMNEYVYLNGILLTKSEYTIYEQGLYFYYIQDDGSLASNSLNDGDIVDFIYSGGILDVPTPQVQSNWAETDEFSVSYILNKPTIPTVDPDTVVDPNYVATDENFTTADHIKLDSIETGAQANIPNTVVDPNYVATDENFTTADHSKLNSIETGAQVNKHKRVVAPTYVSTDENFTTADHSKLNGIEAGAQVNTVTSVNGSTGAVIVSLGGSSGFTGNYNDLFNKPDLTVKADLVGGKLDTSQIPDLAVTEYLGAVANETAMLALTGEKGDWCNRSDTGQMFIISGTDPTQLASWAAISYPASPVVSVAGKTGAVTLTNNDISGGGVTATSGTFTSRVDFSQIRATAGGTAASPTILPGYDNDTGLFHPATNSIGFTTTGVERARITADGNFGIGTDQPGSTLELKSSDPRLTIRDTDASSNFTQLRNTSGNTYLTNAGTLGDLIFINNGEHFRIKSTGNVGIGTTSPQAKLHVRGGDAISSRAYFERTGTNASTAFIGLDGAGAAFGSITNSNLSFYTGSNNLRMVVQDSTGNVGIGTSNPQSKLDVNGTATANNYYLGVGAGTYGIVNDTSIEMYGSASSQVMLFKVNGNNERMRINSSGNVGIGTTNPQSKLEVLGVNRDLLKLFISTGTDGVPAGILLQGTTQAGNSSNQTRLSSKEISGASVETATTEFGIDVRNTGDAFGEPGRVATFLGNGNVGIGTDNPQAKLDVDGTIEANDLTINGDSFRNIPKNSKTAAYTISSSDVGKVICITTGGVTVTTGVFTAGDAVSIYNDSGSDQTITEGSTSTLRLVGSPTTGDRTLAGYGLCTLLCVDSADTFVIAGAGVS